MNTSAQATTESEIAFTVGRYAYLSGDNALGLQEVAHQVDDLGAPRERPSDVSAEFVENLKALHTEHPEFVGSLPANATQADVEAHIAAHPAPVTEFGQFLLDYADIVMGTTVFVDDNGQPITANVTEQ